MSGQSQARYALAASRSPAGRAALASLWGVKQEDIRKARDEIVRETLTVNTFCLAAGLGFMDALQRLANTHRPNGHACRRGLPDCATCQVIFEALALMVAMDQYMSGPIPHRLTQPVGSPWQQQPELTEYDGGQLEHPA